MSQLIAVGALTFQDGAPVDNPPHARTVVSGQSTAELRRAGRGQPGDGRWSPLYVRQVSPCSSVRPVGPVGPVRVEWPRVMCPQHHLSCKMRQIRHEENIINTLHVNIILNYLKSKRFIRSSTRFLITF